MLKIYLDNCCFNRPFDDQSQIRIRLETEAKLYIQEKIVKGEIQLVWSYVLDYENVFNPYEERRRVIERWRALAVRDISESREILSQAKAIQNLGLKSKDALHLACAISGSCDFFLSTDDVIIRKMAGFERINALDPINFLEVLEVSL
jgi:predicted nucleic acid-binding protein